MKIIATKVRGADLQTGDLFSFLGPEYWDSYESNGSLGEKVYIRTPSPCPQGQEEDEVFRIEISKVQ